MADKPPKNETGTTVQTAEGKVRPGNRKVYKRATLDEVERRVVFVRGLLARRAYKSEIKHILFARYSVGHRQAERLMARARAMLREEANVSLDQARQDSVALYVSLIRDTDDDRIRLIAQARLDAIFGVLAAPRAPVNSDGSPAVPQVNVRVVQAALADEKGRDLLAQLCEHAAGLDMQQVQTGLKEIVPQPVEERMKGNPPHGPDGPA